jgi:hypothetical protein
LANVGQEPPGWGEAAPQEDNQGDCVIADRLAHNVAFISNLMESGVEFHAVDFPQANRLTLHILAAVAKLPSPAISELPSHSL